MGTQAVEAQRTALQRSDRKLAAAAAAVLAHSEVPSREWLPLVLQALMDDGGPICWCAAIALRNLATTAPPSVLLPAVPLLRQARARHWTVPPVGVACREALEAILALDAKFSELPLPAAARANSADLPVAVRGNDPEAEHLPLSAGPVLLDPPSGFF